MALLYQSPTRNLPSGYIFRGATLKDVPTVITLFNQRQRNKSGNENHQINEILQEWQSQKFNPAMDVRLIFDPREHLVGYIEVWTVLNPPALPWVWGCVHPDFEGRGIGTALLRWAEARVRLAIEYMPTHRRAAARFGTLHSMTNAAALCSALGWNLVDSEDNPAPLSKKITGALRLVSETDTTANSRYDIYEKVMCIQDEIIQPAW